MSDASRRARSDSYEPARPARKGSLQCPLRSESNQIAASPGNVVKGQQRKWSRFDDSNFDERVAAWVAAPWSWNALKRDPCSPSNKLTNTFEKKIHDGVQEAVLYGHNGDRILVRRKSNRQFFKLGRATQQ